jgi:DNA-binding MarR family transcriptional regulator
MKSDVSRTQLLQADGLGHEARAEGGDHAALKLWLRLLATSTQIEDEIRRRLRARFGISLPRFDYLAQLYRQPDGLTMKNLSRQLMVTGGNVTGLTDELAREGLVERVESPTDGRSWIVRLTEPGRSGFQAMAAEHEQWILELFAGLDAKAVQQLHAQLGVLRVHLTRLQQHDNSGDSP